MLKLINEQLDWLPKHIPDHPPSPNGGRPPADKRRKIESIFWILDNGAKWKDLPRRFGARSTVHRWFQIWTHAGVFEQIMREAGRLIGWSKRAESTGCMNALSMQPFPKQRAAGTGSEIPTPEKV